MKIEIDTDVGGKVKILLDGVAWAVHDIKETDDGKKMLVFGDEKIDILIPLDATPAGKMGSQLITKAASSLITADVHDIAALRKDRNGS